MGKLAPARTRYTTVAIWLHWAIAAFILFNLASGLLFDAMPKGVRGAVIPLHISSGVTVLVLTIVRIAWRLTHRPPPMLPMAGWEKGMAHIVHFCLYLAMLGMPLTGWAMISAHPSPPAAGGTAAPTPADQPPGARAAPEPRVPTMIWGVIPLPMLSPIVHLGDGPDGAAKLHEAHELFEGRHGVGGWILLGLFLLHVAGALKHQFVDRRRELARMGVGAGGGLRPHGIVRHTVVIPAKAGIHGDGAYPAETSRRPWIPAFARMTVGGRLDGLLLVP